ncbi:hypothetical protein EUX98_g6516 [Antrodiella citrinella]|uniref:F-box domain-containing protein n=1 Tax=Antrodiella citrinella TaxID=2447956 RepID=A0A4V3XI23_9APHY|nr:hypothetical protein EUX98_g6516 [Antrodiella citrinella]
MKGLGPLLEIGAVGVNNLPFEIISDIFRYIEPRRLTHTNSTLEDDDDSQSGTTDDPDLDHDYDGARDKDGGACDSVSGEGRRPGTDPGLPKPYIASASSVSHAWREAALPILFHDVCVTLCCGDPEYRRKSLEDFMDFAAPLARIRTCIRFLVLQHREAVVSLYPYVEDMDPPAALMSSLLSPVFLPNLQFLRLSHVLLQPPGAEDARYHNLERSPRPVLRYLRVDLPPWLSPDLDSDKVTDTYILHLLSIFGRVDHLSLCGAPVLPDDAVLDLTTLKPLCIAESLCVQVPQFSAVFQDALVSSGALDQLRRLSIILIEDGIYERDPVDILLRSVGPLLEHLRIEIRSLDRSMASHSGLGLEFCTNLQTLTFERIPLFNMYLPGPHMITSYVFSWLAVMLRSILLLAAPRSLQVVKLIMSCEGKYWDEDTWQWVTFDGWEEVMPTLDASLCELVDRSRQERARRSTRMGSDLVIQVAFCRTTFDGRSAREAGKLFQDKLPGLVERHALELI